MAKCAHSKVTANATITQSRSHMRWVVSHARTYTRGITILELNSIATASYQCTGCTWPRILRPHLAAPNCSWRLLNQCTLEEITSRVNKHMKQSQLVHWEMKGQMNSEKDNTHTQTSDSKHTWRGREKHTGRKAGKGTKQCDMIHVLSTGWISSVPTSALNSKRLSATADTLDWWWR